MTWVNTCSIKPLNTWILIYAYEKWGRKVISNTKSDIIRCFFAQKRYLKAHHIQNLLLEEIIGLEHEIRERRNVGLSGFNQHGRIGKNTMKTNGAVSKQREGEGGKERRDLRMGHDCVKDEESGKCSWLFLCFCKNEDAMEERYAWLCMNFGIRTIQYGKSTTEIQTAKWSLCFQ